MSVTRGFDRKVPRSGATLPVGEATPDQVRQSLTGVVGIPVGGSGPTPAAVTAPKPQKFGSGSGYGGNLTGVSSMSDEQIADAARREAALIAAGETPSVTQFSDWILNNALGAYTPTPDVPTTSGDATGGGAAAPSYDLTALTNYVNEQLANVGTQYGGYGTQLEAQRAAAAQRIADANAAALARMQTVDPMSQFNYNVDIEALPMAAGTDYLRRIGASTADVDATRALGRQLVNAQIGAGRTFAQQIADAQAADRAARIAAVESAGLQGVTGLESTAAAMQERIRKAQLAEERRLQELLLQAQLKYGVA